MSRSITLAPTWPQYDLLSLQALHPALIGGFGSGKTGALVDWLLLQKLQFPQVDSAYYAPTYDLIRLIAWPRFMEKLEAWGYKYRLNKSERMLYIRGYGRIIFRTMENPETIVGFEVGDSAADEIDVLPTEHAKDVWRRILSRNRQKKRQGKEIIANRAAVGSTPEGFKFAYERYGKTQDENYPMVRAPTRSNLHNLPPGYIDDLQADYPPQLLEAYIDGRFVNLTSGTVYHAFHRDMNHTSREIKKGDALHIGMDFNVRKMHAVVNVIDEAPELSRRVRVSAVDEFAKLLDTPAMIESITERYGKPGDKFSMTVYPDASGKSKSSKGATESDVSMLKDAGFIVRSPDANPPIKERVTAMNGMFCNGNGERHLLVNTDRCPVLTEALEQQTWGPDGLPDKSEDKDHPNDAEGYFIHYRFPVRARKAAAKILEY